MTGGLGVGENDLWHQIRYHSTTLLHPVAMTTDDTLASAT